MDLYKKFIFVNADTGAGEMDASMTFPAANLQAIDIVDATSAVFVFTMPIKQIAQWLM